MDFIKKNAAWIALAGLALSVYLYYKLMMPASTTDKTDKTDSKAGFAGKINGTNPLNA